MTSDRNAWLFPRRNAHKGENQHSVWDANDQAISPYCNDAAHQRRHEISNPFVTQTRLYLVDSQLLNVPVVKLPGPCTLLTFSSKRSRFAPLKQTSTFAICLSGDILFHDDSLIISPFAIFY